MDTIEQMTIPEAGACFARFAGILAADSRAPGELLHRACRTAAALTSPRGCPGAMIDAAHQLASEAASTTPAAWHAATSRAH